MGKKRRFYVMSIYVFGIVFWFFLVLLLGIYRNAASLILWLTPIVFLISMYNTKSINEAVESRMFGTSFFETGLVIAIAIMAWAKDLINIDHRLLVVILVAMLFTLLGHLEIWVPVKWQSVYKHVKSVFQVYSVILFCYLILSIIEYGVSHLVPKPKDKKSVT